MKRCPECYEIYENSEKFCEIDGSRLLFDPALSTGKNDSARSDELGLKSQSVAIGLIGLMMGIILCLGIYTVWTLQANTQKQEAPVQTSRIQEATPARRAPAQIPAPQPTVTETTEPEAENSPAAPSEDSAVTENKTVTARLNQGPVSTGRPAAEPSAAEVQTFIEMTDGSTLDVDAAWEDTQGIWYRRGGLVSFLESRRVKAISARNEPKSSSTSSK